MSTQAKKKAAPKVTQCRVCKNTDLAACMDVGEQYLSSIFPDSLDYREKFEKYPMDMVLCRRSGPGHCGLLQLGHDLDLTSMYEAYPYTSSSNSSMKKILKDVADSGFALGHLKPGDTVLDIGANDGTLLSYFTGKGYSLKGIDAAQNIQPVFSAPDFVLERGFFSREKFSRISRGKAKLIFSIAMFYHLSDPVAFSRDAAACLEEDGAWIIQMAYLDAMLKTNMYDNIVHEHAGYYGIETLQWVMDQAGLEIFDVLLNDVYGGSFRAFVKKKGAKSFPRTARYEKLLAEERKSDLFNPETYREFDRRIRKTRRDLTALVSKIRAEGKTIWAYGASTKGNTILQYCGLTSKEITAAADANPFKFGKFMIASDIPVRDENEMRKEKPDYLLALPYSFVEGFIQREAELVKRGTKFIVPLPEVKILP